MLVLTRKKHRSVLLSISADDIARLARQGGQVEIKVTVVEAKERVRLGFDAPVIVNIVREELVSDSEPTTAMQGETSCVLPSIM